MPVRYGRDEYIEAAINSQTIEPKNIVEALEQEDWKTAANAEYSSLIENDTWDLVDLPEGRKPVECKWILKIKRGSDGSIKRYKARLVAKGFFQKHGTDYDETFAPVIRYSSIRTLIAYAVQNNMKIDQMDVVTAFLNSKLEEDTYMTQPEGYVKPGEEKKVCKLKRSLYGLKQSPRCWNMAFKEHMKSINLKPSTAYPCIFVRKEKTGEVSIIVVYVDDLIVVAKTDKRMQEIKESLTSKFKMKDLGRLQHCLRITVEDDNSGSCLWLHQKPYISSMLDIFGLAEAKTVSTPANFSAKLRKDDDTSKMADPTLYQSMVGSPLYAAMGTRPDIAQAVGAASKFSSNPSEAHMTAVKRILRFKGNINLGLKYEKSENSVLIGYSDADWAGDLDDRHSTSGNLFLMAGGAISWFSKSNLQWHCQQQKQNIYLPVLQHKQSG